MSLEAIEMIQKIEKETQERKSAAEAEARRIVADAERAGQELLERIRTEAAEAGRHMLSEAEAQAATEAEAIAADARKTGDALRKDAETRLDAAAELIIGKVVNH